MKTFKYHFKEITTTAYLSIFLFTLISCATKEKLQGTYRSNIASLGFFRTTITFENDSIFKYNFSGDLTHQNLTGKYALRKNMAYLKFTTNKGEIESESDSVSALEALQGNYHHYDLKEEKGIPYHLKLQFRKEKLLMHTITNGKLVRYAKVYNGKKWKYTKVYLKKVQ
ncbi:hypothetical protein [Chryseobacterium hispalense]|uniref:hypothetical protein n=1 Tax=Chryseobacterium hispalense TaxID=1453492 RepID=UPI00391C67A3